MTPPSGPPPHDPDRPLRLAALISGGGRTLMNILDRIEAGRLHAEVGLVIASRGGATGVPKAQQRGLPVRVVPPGVPEAAGNDLTVRWLAEQPIDLVCLCGYLKLLRLEAWMVGRVINIHPALLPEFGGPGMYGRRVHEAVLAAGRPDSGCTVHFVDEEYDHGPIILQRRCPVLPGDDHETLAARVFEQECIAYPEAIQLFAENRIRLVEGRVVIDDPPPRRG